MSILNKIDEITKIKLSSDEVKKYANEIMKKNNCRKILGMIDEQIYDYVDSDWEEDGEYESEQEWYIDYGRGEAESDIVEKLVRDIEKKKKMKFHIDSFVDIGKEIASKCSFSY